MDTAALLTVSLTAAAFGIGLGVLLGRYVWPNTSTAGGESSNSVNSRLNEEYNALRARIEQADSEHRAAAQESARLAERVLGLDTKIQEQVDTIRGLSTERDSTASELRTASAELATLRERERGLLEKVAAQTLQLETLNKQLTTEFENIATRVLKANAAELSESSQKTLAGIINPFRERIQEFQQKVQTTYDAETREVLSLKTQIKLIVETNQALGTQAEGLAKALRGDAQKLGRWGELVLERILQAAGLVEGREYITQGRGLGLKDEDGGTQKPDIVVILPEQRTMIIDSKTSLASYDRLISSTDEDERLAFANQFVRDMKVHIDGLAGKRYQDNEKLKSHDCVLMFVPIEGALAAALTTEPDLFTYAWDRRVVIVGPPTLLMTLRTVASIWRYELQGQNAQEIARLAGDLCDKISASLSDLNSVAEKISGALNAHNDAVKRFATGKGNALSIGERIRSLGVKTKRPTPALQVDGMQISGASDEGQEATQAED